MGGVKKKSVLALLCVVLSVLTIAAMMPGMAYAEENTVEESTAEDTATTKIQEPPVDTTTTVPNNYDKNVSSDKIGTDLSCKWLNVQINADEARNRTLLGKIAPLFNYYGLGDIPCSDFVMEGDMSIKNQDGTYDTTNKSAHAVDKNSTYDLKADLDVSAVHNSVDDSKSIVGNADVAYVNNLETGFCATFSIGDDLDGEFYVPNNLADAKAHYQLSSGDIKPLIYRINYASSTFTKKKISIVMDLDLTKMDGFTSSYNTPQSTKMLYGKSGIMENFNHADDQYGSTYDTSTFGNLKTLIDHSAKTISLDLKGVQLHSATGNKTTTETDSAITTTTQGTIKGALVGYMNAEVGNSLKMPVSYVWGAMQDTDGKDINATDDSVSLSTQFTETTQKEKPIDVPDTPVTPSEPEQPQKHEVTIHEDNPTTDKPETTTKITVDDQGKVEKPAQDPVRPGYKFDGWYSDPECTIPYDFSKPVTGDLHIYAKWNKNVKPQTAKKVTGILLPKAIAHGSSRQTVTWTPLTNVDGYYVYKANCNTPKKIYHFKKVADVKASSPRVYKTFGLKKGVAYKYYVAAYQIKNGKKKVVKKSLSVHSIAGNIMRKHVNYTNVKSVSVRKNAVTLKVGKTYRIQPAVKGVFSNCAILQKGHAAMFRYVYIKDGKNISVSGNGVVKAKKAGKCNVYVLGTNGVRARVAVTVK